MKLIMENWRGFLQESLSIDSKVLSQIALVHDKTKDVQTLVLYMPGTQPPKLVAAIEIAKTQEPCIPETCLLYTSPSPRDLSTSRMPSSA